MFSSLLAEVASETTKTGKQGCTIKQGLIILIEFPDIKHSVDRRFAQKRFFKELNSYVQEMSYNKVCIDGDITEKWHRMSHPILGGVEEGKRMVPCLYDHDLQAKPVPLRETFIEATINMGFWDPMSCHFYKWVEPTPGISSWTKMRLNWIDSSKIRVVKPGETRELLLGSLEDMTSDILAIKIPLSETTYYLIENRQPIGFDRYLPGSGIL